MSIVEKAVDKLKKVQPAEEAPPVEAAPPAPAVRREPPAATPAPSARPAEVATPALHVNFEMLAEQGLFPPDEFASRIADEFRRIKRPLIANITGKTATRVERGTRIMVASALRGEGKTFTSFNLALSLALEQDFSVLLVDGDVAKRDLSAQLGLDDQPGLIDVLADPRMSASEVIVSTDVMGLSILPAGRRNPLSTELLASRKMEYLLDELTRTIPNRIIVFDSPPLLATSEAQVLADSMGQIVFVVSAGKTQQHDVAAALETLDQSKSINCVLNRATASDADDYYGDYYGSYYK